MKTDILDIWINRVGMSAIVLASLGYVLFGASFAQLRFEFSFLDFPIFIGEILLIVCSLLFIVKSVRQKWELGAWRWILAGYLFFVLFKAFSGYFTWGPLAFRDAALFYYPFFVVLGYSFWSYDFWGDRIRYLSIIMISSIFILRQFIVYWPCSLIIMGVILALQAKSIKERMIMIGAVFLFAPYEAVFNVYYRTVFLSLLITMVFIGSIFFILFCKDRRIRIVGAVLGCFVLGMVLLKVGQTGVWSTYVIKDAKPLAVILPQEPSRGKYLFHPVGNAGKPDTIKEFLQRIFKGWSFTQKEPSMAKEPATVKEPVMVKEFATVKEPVTVKNPVVENDDDFLIKVKEADTRFRYYIWRDMVFEYVWYKPLFGFDFGRPLLSSTMQYYGISDAKYGDGWVGAHNSFLDMIYRAGIIGLAMVLYFLFIWFSLLRDFYILKDCTGLLLCAVLLNWIVSANFFLIFELPYTAIPVWTILGVTLKHRMLLKKASC